MPEKIAATTSPKARASRRSREKSEAAYRTISEVAALLSLEAHVLRFWESKFPQIQPLKRAGGRRYYRPEDVDLLRGIQHLLHEQGYTIKGVTKLMREAGPKHVFKLGHGLNDADRAPPSLDVAAPVGKAAPLPKAKAKSGKARTGEGGADQLSFGGLSQQQRGRLGDAVIELESLRDYLKAALDD